MGLVDMEGGLQLYDGEIRARNDHSEVEGCLPPLRSEMILPLRCYIYVIAIIMTPV